MICLLATFFAIYSQLRPLFKLKEQMQQVMAGNLNAEIATTDSKDEISSLSRTFNNMVTEIGHLIEEIQVTQKRESELRFEMLLAQINPHFLFNTLNMIACTAKLEDAVDTEKMILSLGNLFRYNLKTREQTVTLDRELKIVNDYMYLQKMRFGSRIKYRLSLETDAADVIIPSLSLQPLVENAVVHGLSKKETGGILHIRIWKKDRMLILSEVAAAMKEHRTAKIGIGLGNIYKRVHMMYQKGDLRIYSREGKGTVIQLMIPQGEETQGEEVYVPTADRR